MPLYRHRLAIVLPSIWLDSDNLFILLYVMPQLVAWPLFGLGLIIAVVLTYHELRVKILDRSHKERIRTKLAQCMHQGDLLFISSVANADEMGKWETQVTLL